MRACSRGAGSRCLVALAAALAVGLGWPILLERPWTATGHRSHRGAAPRLAPSGLDRDSGGSCRPALSDGLCIDTADVGRPVVIEDSFPRSYNATLPTDCRSRLGIGDDGYFTAETERRVSAAAVWSYADHVSGRIPVTRWFKMKLWAADAADAALLDAQLTPRARIPPASFRERYCPHRDASFSPAHAPDEPCAGDDADETVKPSSPLPHHGTPWCMPPLAGDGISVFSADCVGVENRVSHPDVLFTLFTLGAAGDGILSSHRNQVAVDAGVTVEVHDELGAISTISYAGARGHFLIEQFPLYLLLDRVLPPHIPILYMERGADTAATSVWMALLQDRSLFPSNRTFLLVPEGEHMSSHYAAKRLFYLRDSRPDGASPYVSWYAHRLAAQVLETALLARYGPVPRAEAVMRIIFLQRGAKEARHVERSTDIHRIVAEELPGAVVDEFVPTTDNWETARRTRRGCLAFGAHGANLNNLLFLPRGCWVVEVGYFEGDFQVPPMFYCEARNLGHTYHLSIATRGSHGSILTPDLDDWRHIVRAYKREVVEPAMARSGA